VSAEPIRVVISEDPRTSPRPAEALRVALGLALDASAVRVVLVGEGARVLDDRHEELEDGEALERHRRILAERGVVFEAEEGALDGLRVPARLYRIDRADPAGLGRALNSASRAIVF